MSSLLRKLPFAVVAVAAPATAYAHVKWFTDPSAYPLRTDLIVGPSTALLLCAAAAALLWLSLFQRMFGGADWPRLRIWQHLAAGGPTQLAVLAAIGLVSAAVRPSLFAPNLGLSSGPLGLAIAGLELIAAATFVSGLADWLGALLILLLTVIGVAMFSPVEMAEQLHWVGVAVAILLVGRRVRQLRPTIRAQRALAILRITTGLAILAAACEEKLWNPALGRAFLADHPLFNAPHALLGLPVSDDQFVLMMGIAEGVIGILLVSGLMTRVVVLAMWLPFNVGIPLLPAQELLGHLPILGAMYLLLAHGSGAMRIQRVALVDLEVFRQQLDVLGRSVRNLGSGVKVGA